MDINDPRWLQHLDVITTWGKASTANETDPPTDEQLWAISRVRVELDLPEQIDQTLLTELRAAFDAGRQATRINMQALADALRRRGHDAVVDYTGGNTATLYAGSQIIDRHGDPRWAFCAGPGWFEQPGLRRPVADTTEFVVGPNSDDAWAVPVPEHLGWGAFIALIVAVINEVDKQRLRSSQAVEAAQQAMWAMFAIYYPEITGDHPAGVDDRLAALATRLLSGWLDASPTVRTVPAHIAALAAAEPGGSTGMGSPER